MRKRSGGTQRESSPRPTQSTSYFLPVVHITLEVSEVHHLEQLQVVHHRRTRSSPHYRHDRSLHLLGTWSTIHKIDRQVVKKFLLETLKKHAIQDCGMHVLRGVFTCKT